MSIEKPSKPKPLTLEQLTSEAPISGLGYERFTDDEKKDVEALLSSASSAFGDPILERLHGETLMDLMEYARSKPNTPERLRTKKAILAAIEQARKESME